MTTATHITLFELVKRLPKNLKPEHYDIMIGDCFKFTHKEADDIVRAANILVAKFTVQKTTKPALRCMAFVGDNLCHAEIKDNGHNHSGFCESCYYPGISNDYLLYKTYREEGYSRDEALGLACIGNNIAKSIVVKEKENKRY